MKIRSNLASLFQAIGDIQAIGDSLVCEFGTRKFEARNWEAAPEEMLMICSLSALALVLGTGLAHASNRYPQHVEMLETSAGVLLLSGLALIGAALPRLI